MNTIDDIVLDLTEEEKELLHEIIDECRVREAFLLRERDVINENALKLDAVTRNFQDNLALISDIFLSLSRITKVLNDETKKKMLLGIPEDKFYHA